MHLALRDVHYERALQLLGAKEHVGMQALDENDFEAILFQLRTARDHGRFAVRDGGRHEKDQQFSLFINMLAGNVNAALSMLNLKQSVEAEDGFFFSFLEINHASVALQAEEYERRARDIIRSMHSTLALANQSYNELKEANREAFSEFERTRYDKAAAHGKEHGDARKGDAHYKRKSKLFH
jgi:hypothetical protein